LSLLTRRSSRAPSSNWEKGKGECRRGNRRKEERRKTEREREGACRREGTWEKEERGRGRGGKGAPAIRPSGNAGSGHLAGGGIMWRGEEGKGRKERGEGR